MQLCHSKDCGWYCQDTARDETTVPVARIKVCAGHEKNASCARNRPVNKAGGDAQLQELQGTRSAIQYLVWRNLVAGDAHELGVVVAEWLVQLLEGALVQALHAVQVVSCLQRGMHGR